MKIWALKQNKINFKGEYWLTTDIHDKLPMYCGTLREIETAIKNSKEKSTLLDNGDTFGKIFKLTATKKILDNFVKINPDTNIVFNLGNLELYTLSKPITKNDKILGYENYAPSQQDKANYLVMVRQLKAKNSKVHFVSCFAKHLEENCGVPKGLIEPYAIIDDIIDGEEKKVLVLGTSIEKNNKYTIEKQLEELKKVIDEIKEKNEQYDCAILLSHNTPDKNTNKDFSKIIDFIEKEGIKNLKFIVGGHTHALHQEIYNGKNIIFPPSSGKGAIRVALHKNEVYAPKMNIGADSHDFSTLENSPDIISNSNISNPIDISFASRYFLEEAFPKYQTPIIKMPLTIGFKDYSEPFTNTSELGTFFANTARDATKTDFAFFLFSDFREKTPEKGKSLTPYNIKDIINIDKSMWTIENISIPELKELFEISLKNQKDPENDCMLEFSDNIRITRFKEPQDGGVVKQIEIKENNKWVELLDDNRKPKTEFNKKTFTATTCSIIAQGKRHKFEHLKNKNPKAYIDKSGEIYNPRFALEKLDAEFEGRLLMSNLLLWGLNKLREKEVEKIERAQIITV